MAQEESQWLHMRQRCSAKISDINASSTLNQQLDQSGLDPSFQDLIETPIRLRDMVHTADQVLAAARKSNRFFNGEESEAIEAVRRLQRAGEQYERVLAADPFNLGAKIGMKRAAALLLDAEKNLSKIRKIALLKSRHGDGWQDALMMETVKSKAEMQKIFDCIDVDKSGTLDRQELKQLLEYFSLPNSDRDLDAAMAAMDDDMSGEIDFAEFVSHIGLTNPYHPCCVLGYVCMIVLCLKQCEWHEEQQRRKTERMDVKDREITRQKPKSWAELASQSMADVQAEAERESLAVEANKRPATAPGATSWGLGRVLTWSDGTARAIFSQEEYNRATSTTSTIHSQLQ
eukprot:SAG31_NODE_5351_length_2593_cov_0.929832_2_plen_345_part_00